jgi:hypothetical protein
MYYLHFLHDLTGLELLLYIIVDKTLFHTYLKMSPYDIFWIEWFFALVFKKRLVSVLTFFSFRKQNATFFR